MLLNIKQKVLKLFVIS